MTLYQDDCVKVMDELIADGKKVNAIITDVPYGVGFKGGNYNDSVKFVSGMMDTWLSKMYDLLEEDGFLAMYVGVKTIHLWITSAINNKFTFKNILATRSYNNGAKKADNNFGFQFQPVCIFSKGSGRKFNEVDFIPTSLEWFKDKRNKNPKKYTYEYPNWIKTEWAFASEKRSSKNNHPNEKSVKLLKFLVEVLTDKEDTVLDPFMGSGSTGIACKETQRHFIGIEINNSYFNIAQKRIGV